MWLDDWNHKVEPVQFNCSLLQTTEAQEGRVLGGSSDFPKK